MNRSKQRREVSLVVDEVDVVDNLSVSVKILTSHFVPEMQFTSLLNRSARWLKLVKLDVSKLK